MKTTRGWIIDFYKGFDRELKQLYKPIKRNRKGTINYH